MWSRRDDDTLMQALREALPGAQVEIDRSDGRSLYVKVTAAQFNALDDGEQQSLVWGIAMNTLGDYRASDIDFIFTYRPEQRTPAAS